VPLAIAWVFPAHDGQVLELHGASASASRLARSDTQPRTLEGFGEIVIGREGVLAFVDDELSRRHATLTRHARALHVTDLDSRNGVFVNCERVTSARLRPGDVLRLGQHVGVVTEYPGLVGELAPGLFGGARLASALAPARRALTLGSEGRLGKGPLPIVLEGETGTGKELAAAAIHAWSGRRGDFVAVNCSAIPEGIAEAELFGAEPGYVNQLRAGVVGHFRSAQRGTLLLDELPDLAPATQSKLLRVLEEHVVQPLGASKPIPFDVQVVVATPTSVAEMARDGRFRADLWQRLNGVRVRLPPLRERREDVPALLQRALTKLSGGAPPACQARLVERLCACAWPGNVRELMHVVEQLWLLHGGERVLRAGHVEGLLEQVAEKSAPGTERGSNTPPTQRAVDLPRDQVARAIEASGSNYAEAARRLGISRQALQRLRKKFWNQEDD
jgi:transcriptional regulator of acetoin/glycerol metabolism